MDKITDNPAFWLLGVTVAVVLAQAGRYLAWKRSRA